MAIDIDLSRHPIRAIYALRKKYGSDLELNFGIYTYHRRARKEERHSFKIRIGDITSAWLRRELGRLSPDQELSIESRVRLDGVRMHIPMLDFKGMTRGQLLAVMGVFDDEYQRSIRVYFSGRSFHAYFLQLLTSREWVKFMGSALLCNTPGKEVVDQRWVGHRLIGGYAALRWSNNTGRYSYPPIRVATQTLDLSAVEKSKVLHA